MSGYVSDTLGVFGIPDGMLPVVKAAQMLNEKVQGAQGTAGTTPAAPAPAATGSSSSAAVAETKVETTNADPYAHVYDPSQGVDQWEGVVDAVFGLGGWSMSDVPRTLEQMDIESDGNPDAQNNDDVNAQNASPRVA